MSKTHWKKVVSDPTYIGEADFEPGEEKVLTIASVAEKETIVTQEGKSTKAVVHWAENEKAMILNVARSKAISKVVGSPYFEDWVGKKVQLYIDNKVKAFGEIVSAVRVRTFVPKESVPKADVPSKCELCGKKIQPAFGLTAEQLVLNTQKRFSKALCASCAEAEANKAKDGEK